MRAIILSIALTSGLSGAANAALLSQWQFDSYAGGAFTNRAPETGTQSGTAKLYSILPSGGSYNSVAGTTLGAADNQATSAFQATQTSGNRIYTFGMVVSGTGLQDFVLTLSALSTSGETINWAYSLNGTTYTSFGSTSVSAAGTWAAYTVDFSSVTAIDNQATVYFQGTVNLNGSSKNISFDNISVTAVPEKSTIAAGIFGLLFAVTSATRKFLARRA